MKKALSLALALVMALSLSVCAFAETFDSRENEGTKLPPYESSNNVTVKVNGANTVNVYYVNVVWDATTTFTYNMGTKTWNPENHNYDVTGNGWEGGKDTVTVGVYNHSDLPVTAALTASGTLPGGMTSNITDFSGNIASAVGTTTAESNGAAGTTPYAEATYKLTAGETVAAGSVTITLKVTISAVSSEP